MNRMLRSAGVASLVAFVGAACGSSSPSADAASNGAAGSSGAGADASSNGEVGGSGAGADAASNGEAGGSGAGADASSNGEAGGSGAGADASSNWDAGGLGAGADVSLNREAGSSGTGADASMTGDAASPGQDATVTIFDKTLFSFPGGPGGGRRRTANGMFPAGGTFARIVLHIQLDCPAGGCDHWDRVGSVGVVTQPPVKGGSRGTVVEIARFVTPFGVGAPVWDYDVTDLAPLLTGNLSLQGFIDTWSPQGNPAANGAGWLLTVTFSFTGGVPAKIPMSNRPVWSWPADSDPPSAPYGDPADPIATHLPAQTISLPSGASSYALRTFITGHGQGSAGNCAEFCKATHAITVGSKSFMQTPWRACCAPDPACQQQPNPAPAPGVAAGQHGTYMYPRAGWCPGASVDAWTQDVTQAIGAGSSITLAYAPDSYVNACRASAPSCDVTRCTSSAGCSYNGGSHTPPAFYISSLLVAYK